MSRHHYMALNDIGPWEIAVGNARFHLRPYIRYLKQAIRAMQDRILHLSWSEASEGESEDLEERLREGLERPHRSRGKKRRRNRRQPRSFREGVWVFLSHPSDNPETDEKVFEAFYEEKKVYDHPRCNRNNQLDVLGFDEEYQAIKLSGMPQSSEDGDENNLYLRPDDYQLQCQLKAIYKLLDAPPKWCGPLVRLLSTKARWNASEQTTLFREELAILGMDRDGAEEQRRFVELALGTSDFMLLEGPPGSGKTTAISELILQSLRRGQRVMVVASTHVAVDNVLERLIEWQDRNPQEHIVVPIRIGDEGRISSEVVKPYQIQQCIRSYKADLQDFLEAPTNATPVGEEARQIFSAALEDQRNDVVGQMILDAANVVCGTTIGILQHPAIKKMSRKKQESWGEKQEVFDIMIIDEASKTTFSEFLVPAMFARKWVVVGDIKQLSPYVEEEELSDNLRGKLEREAATICMDVFRTSQTAPHYLRRSTLVVLHDEKSRAVWHAQARAAEVPFVDLDEVSDETCLGFLYATLFMGSPGAIERHQHRLPADLEFVREESDGSARVPAGLWSIHAARSWECHRRWWRNRPQPKPKSKGKKRRRPVNIGQCEEEVEWVSELTWRLIRAYELRFNAVEREHLEKAIKQLLPAELLLGGTGDRLDSSIRDLRRVALPSILELLQHGFETFEGQRNQVVLTNGLPERALQQRLVSLSFQHRMHPDISRFSRDHFYSSGEQALLQDAGGMRERREVDWFYHAYHHRVHWQHVDGRGQGNKSKNQNDREVDQVMDALCTFAEQAQAHPWPQDHRRHEQPYEVAVLTFYRAQEAALRQRLRHMSGQYRNSRNFYLPSGNKAQRKHVHVTLCTVDRFQGHEADFVILSFVKSGTIGFLNSPNRLNVALTRARYQLLLVGDRVYFSRQSRSPILQALASDPHFGQTLSFHEEKRQ